MTQEQFDNYPFSVYTVITVNGRTIQVKTVDFANRTINGWHYSEIEDIKN